MGPKTRERPGRQARERALGLAGAAVAVALILCFSTLAAAVFWLHLSIRPVLSGSMRPTYGPGWAIVTRSIPVGQVEPGDIVVFTPPSSSTPFAHRVVSVTPSPRGPVVTTKGDANPVADPWHARLEGRTVPEVVGAVPVVGYLMVGLGRPLVHVLLVAVLGSALCVVGVRSILHGPAKVAEA
jgi:signal peptidase